MKRKVTKEMVIERLIKLGSNKETAISLVENNFDDAIRIRPEGTVSKIAEVVFCI